MVLKEYERWRQFAQLDEDLREQLNKIEGNHLEIENAFYDHLTFGTGGIRGKLGPGTNRMNIYTVRKTIKGLAEYIKKHEVNYEVRGVVVAYDSRHMSKEFAYEVAKVLGANGIKTHIFHTIQPTPLLSFAVRYVSAVAGIMITASHNPPEYNGLKVYNEKGSQITAEQADEITRLINEVEDELTIETKDEAYLRENRLLNILYDDIETAYLKRIAHISKLSEAEIKEAKSLRVVFTPLHGTAKQLVTKGLQRLNFSNIYVVEEQAVTDPNFSTVSSPNPEEKQAFTMAMELGKEVDADILLATDPDADRLGVAVKNYNGDYETLTGNELGALLLDYILTNTDERLLSNARMIKTIVTSELGRAIASSYGVKTIDTLTGFKYIAEKINEYDATGELFIFGYEESYGYLISSFVRDKDGVQAALLTSEMAEKYKQQGMTLLDALQQLYERHGFYKQGVESLTLEGKNGEQKINTIMERFRENTFHSFDSLKVLYKEDYLNSKRIDVNVENSEKTLTLPQENVVKYMLENNCWLCLRPSGTEPKIKWYYGAYGSTEEEATKRLDMLQSTLREIIVEEKYIQTTK